MKRTGFSRPTLEEVRSKPQKPRAGLKRGSGLSPVSARKRSLEAKSAKRAGKGRKPSTGQLKKKAWTAFSIFIRTRRADKNGMVKCCTCAVIKHWKEMQAGHFLRGRLNSNLFDERGCNEQCYACNVGRDGNVVEYYVWMLINHGQSVIDELRAKNWITHKWAPGELQALLDYYSAINAENPLVKGFE